MFKDSYQHLSDSLISPAEFCFAISPDDVAELQEATKAIYVGNGGDVTLRCVRGEADITFTNVPSGSILDVRVRAVRHTGTTASNIVALA